MYEILDEEFNYFLNDIESDRFVYGRYIDEYVYEDDYSHNDINEAQAMFIKKAREFIHEHFPNKYVVSSSYCVFVISIDEARKRNISEHTIECFTVH